MDENCPVLVSCKPLKSDYDNLRKIILNSDNFTLGRALQNSVVIPFLPISRKHCLFRKVSDDEWSIEDFSYFGIEVNGHKLGKGTVRTLCHEDTITLEPSQEFMYTFMDPASDTFDIPKKRRKMDDSDIINNVKMKFEESQNCKKKHIEEKIQNAKQMQTTSLILKDQLQLDMNRKIHQLESDFALQIENLKGEKYEVEQEKARLIKERDAQLSLLKDHMEGKIEELMDQIKKLNETESELLNENSALKEKLLKERDEFLAELSRESSSKQDMLDKLESKIKEQEEIRIKEKQELEEQLRCETEQLRLAKEKELKDLEELKQIREQELTIELHNMKRTLEEQVEHTEQQRLEAQRQLNEQMEQMKKLTDEEKVKMEHLVKEREEIQKKLSEATANAEKSREELENKVQEREIELAALAAERIQKQADQSSEVISALQEQLEKVRSQLQLVETEKKDLLEIRSLPAPFGEGSSKQTALEEVNEVMESELQCSICGELFVHATTLNCSHTFCKYCITMWKKKKKDCPICRAPLTSECKSLVLDSFIDKMLLTLSDNIKNKRQELLASREELEAELVRPAAVAARATRGGSSYGDSDMSFESEEGESIHEGYQYSYDDDYDSDRSDSDDFEHRYSLVNIPWSRQGASSDSDSGSDDESDSSGVAVTSVTTASAATSSAATTSTATSSAATSSAGASTERANNADASANANAAGLPDSTAQRADGDAASRRRRRVRVAGLPGAYYGGYGRCYACGARGHWAPGCPFR